MNSNLGYGFILVGLAFAAFGAIVGLESGLRRRPSGLKIALACVYGFSAAMLLANLTMIRALVSHDFSVKYVSQVGSLATPLVYTVVSLWSALEGSILFWGAILGVYLFAFAWLHRREHDRYLTLALSTMLAVAAFFAFLLAGPANPFSVVSPVPLDGPGPNPLLQNNILMVVHPPMLYCGYAGMTVPFGMAMAALLRGELGDSWLAPLRRWTLIPWTFLTVGIILGSWWSYTVLGWGGIWAWDPVENASFLPWLTATAFLHSLMVMERRHILKLWTVALALGSFVLTVLGTFMTRSGVFNSVHSFTQSDIGPTFLVFLGIVLLASILALGLRGHLLAPEGHLDSPASREAGMLVNNLLFAALTITVLLGTVYPIASEALRGVRISVGEPYFNSLCLPLGIAILFLMGVGPGLPWGRAPKGALKSFALPAGAAALCAVVCLAAGLRGFLPLLTFVVAAFTAAVTVREMVLPALQRRTSHREGVLQALVVSATRARRRFGGYVVHLGIVVVFVAVAASQGYSQHAEGTLGVGDTLKLGSHTLQFVGLKEGTDPNRTWQAAQVLIQDGPGHQTLVLPRMNFYPTSNDPVGTPAVHYTPKEDVYLSLRAFTGGAAPTATLSTWVFPLVSWIWWAIPIFVLGGLFAAWPQRRRALSAAAHPPAPPPAAADKPQRGAA